MKIWVITDTHFGHTKMIDYCSRPKDFGEKIIKNWNKLVSRNDLVIHLGDVTWTDDTHMDELKGKKILVRGNHDGNTITWYMQHGFDFVCESFVLDYGGTNIIFSHKPLIFHDHDINIHGHLHNLAKLKSCCNAYPLALEVTGYTPVLLMDILEGKI